MSLFFGGGMFGLEPDPAQFRQQSYLLDEFVILLYDRNPIDLDDPERGPNIDLALRKKLCDQDRELLIKMKGTQRMIAREIKVDLTDSYQPLIKCQELLDACCKLGIDRCNFQAVRQADNLEQNYGGGGSVSDDLSYGVAVAMLIDESGFTKVGQLTEAMYKWIENHHEKKVRGFSESNTKKKIKAGKEAMKEKGFDFDYKKMGDI
ncbi:MAG: hypothetical protein ACR2PT_04840 [Endozoicomonas sp.]